MVVVLALFHGSHVSNGHNGKYYCLYNLHSPLLYFGEFTVKRTRIQFLLT